MEKGALLNSDLLTPKPVASSVYVHVPEVRCPHRHEARCPYKQTMDIGDVPLSVFVAVHHLGLPLLRPEEACLSTGFGRARGQDEDQRAGSKHRVQHGVPRCRGRDLCPHTSMVPRLRGSMMPGNDTWRGRDAHQGLAGGARRVGGRGGAARGVSAWDGSESGKKKAARGSMPEAATSNDERASLPEWFPIRNS
jgi:hypothetical protein